MSGFGAGTQILEYDQIQLTAVVQQYKQPFIQPCEINRLSQEIAVAQIDGGVIGWRIQFRIGDIIETDEAAGGPISYGHGQDQVAPVKGDVGGDVAGHAEIADHLGPLQVCNIHDY